MGLGCLLEIVIVFALVAVLSHDQGTSLFLYMFVLAFPMALVRHFSAGAGGMPPERVCSKELGGGPLPVGEKSNVYATARASWRLPSVDSSARRIRTLICTLLSCSFGDAR